MAQRSKEARLAAAGAAHKADLNMWRASRCEDFRVLELVVRGYMGII